MQEHCYLKCIKRSEVVAYDDLGAEAIRRLEIENFPVIVVIDKDGNNLYETAIEKIQKENRGKLNETYFINGL